MSKYFVLNNSLQSFYFTMFKLLLTWDIGYTLLAYWESSSLWGPNLQSTLRIAIYKDIYHKCSIFHWIRILEMNVAQVLTFWYIVITFECCCTSLLSVVPCIFHMVCLLFSNIAWSFGSCSITWVTMLLWVCFDSSLPKYAHEGNGSFIHVGSDNCLRFATWSLRGRVFWVPCKILHNFYGYNLILAKCFHNIAKFFTTQGVPTLFIPFQFKGIVANNLLLTKLL